ncbi:MAG: hypothetical protein ACQEQV_08610 [Fibrobacterota bacterium]
MSRTGGQGEKYDDLAKKEHSRYSENAHKKRFRSCFHVWWEGYNRKSKNRNLITLVIYVE